MENKQYLESQYTMRLVHANKCKDQGNFSDAEIAYKMAGDAAIKLTKMTYGEEQNRWYGRATQIAESLKIIKQNIARKKEEEKQPTPVPRPKKPEEKQEQKPVRPLEEILADLDALEGLKEVKTQVKQYVAMIKNRQERIANNLPIPPFSYHLIFTGNPGTGKTTVARMMAEIFCALGIAENSTLTEVVASDLIAEHIGGTANKTREALDKAMGGVFFLDEAYRLVEDGTKKFGLEAIGEILTAMENHRDSLIVIAAGYEDDMEEFKKANDGLPSRFKTTLNFSDYNGEEMFRIFQNMCKKYEYVLTPEASKIMEKKLHDLYENRGPLFANARDVRNKFEAIYANQAQRMATTEHTLEDLRTIDVCDLYGV